MKPLNRIIINTVVQYTRTLLNVFLSFYSVRLIMNALGVNDYGIYSLVAGVVSMLSFLTNSLVGSTQRFLSYAQGQGEETKLKSVFSNSVVLHIFLGAFIVVILSSITPVLFNGFLNIPSSRIGVAKNVYILVIFMVYISFIVAPYRALLVSHENIIYTSIVDVLDSVFKVIVAILLTYVTSDRLLAYGWMMLAIPFFNLLAFAIYCHVKYPECILPSLHYFDINNIKQLLKYTGWQAYSLLSISLKDQGLAIILNRKLGTVVNAAFGVGGQISGAISFVAISLQNAISPQLTAAEGAGNRNKMWRLANMENKFGFLLLASVGIPTLFEMQAILDIWLVDVPKYAWLFGAMFLSLKMIDMLTVGYQTANRAIGKRIGLYMFITYTPKLLILPLSCYLLHIDQPLWTICAAMIVVEFICMMLRIPLIINEEGFNLRTFIVDVFMRSMFPCIISVILCVLMVLIFDFPTRFIITYLVSISFFIVTAYRYSLTPFEKSRLTDIFNTMKSKFAICHHV